MVSQKGFYESLEDKYYDLLDYLDSKGLPVYKAVDWLESKNIPSFPVALASVFLILVLGFFMISSFFANSEVSVLVQDQEGKPLSSVVVGAYIDNQKFDEKSSDEKGSVIFQLPKGKEVEFRAKKQGYLEAKTTLQIENDKESKRITLQSEITTITKTISVFEAGTGRAFSKNIEIEFTCSEKNSFSKSERVNDGIVEIQVPSDCGSIIAKPIGNYSLGRETIYLSDQNPRLEVSEQAQQKGTAFVSVANSQGNYLPGIDLRLYSVTEQGQQGSLVQEKQTASSGTATFAEVPVGRYYIIAYDKSGNYSEYDGLKQGLVQEVRANSTTNFNLVMAQNVAGKIRLEVRDKATQEKLKNAMVRLYKGNSQLTSRETNEEGRVEFFLGEDIQYDLEIDKAGYLIKKVSTKPLNDIMILEIEQATLENSQSLLVNILDEIGKPIENARVKLKRNSDGSQIGPEIITGLDGRAIFERVEQGTYYVYALKPGYGEKNSDTINVSNRQQNITTIRIPLGSGRLGVSVVDEQGNAIAGANIKVVDRSTFQTIEEATTDSDGKKSFSIRPDKEPFLIVSATNYADYITTPTQVQKDTTKEKRVIMAKAIREFGIELEGIYFNNERISDNENSLSQGQNYKAKFKIHVPKNSRFEEIEAHIRTGRENGSIEKDIVFISKVIGAFNNSQAGTSFNPPNNMALDLQTITSGNSKWFNAIFKKPIAGIYELEAELQVREEARIGSSFELWYRVSGKSNGIIRDPNDSTLGTSANTSAKQGLYANAYKRVLTIGPSSLCNENFCSTFTIENIREGITTSILESYTTQADNKYKLKFDITGNSKTPFSNSQLIIKDRTGSIALNSYKINTALGEERQGKPTGSEITIQVGDISKDSLVSGEIELQPKKEGTIPLEIVLTSNIGAQTEVFKKTILVKVQPAKQMEIDIVPKIIVPLIRNNVLVKVSSEGIALPNTKINVFSNNETIAVGETDFEGIFAFTINSPSEGAQIIITAEKNGYKETRREIKITQNLITTEAENIKLNIRVNDTEPKAIEATILNRTQIPITIEKIYLSKSLEGYAQISFTEPKEGTTILADNNSNLSGILYLGPKANNITQPTKVNGQIIVIATNNVFKQKWLSTIQLEINLGFGEELDNTECFSVTPNDWKIYSTNTKNQEMSFTITNNCTAQGNKVSLKNLSARIIAGNQNALGQFSAETSIEDSQKIILDNRFKTIANEIGKGTEEKLVITFKPENIVSGKAEPRIEVQATHMTSRGEQKLLQRINLSISINNLNECIEVLTNKDIVVQSCPYNLGFANYGTRFSQYVNSRYAPYDPYAAFYGYGTGQPPYLGTANTPAQFADLYNYTGAYYPNNYYMAPFYTGIGSYSPMMANAWSCGAGIVQVRNSCSTDVELSFDAQPGITTKEKTIQVQAGNTADVIIEPTNFFGRYSLTIKGKTKETGQKTTDLKTIYVNVTNPFTKNYRDCISISPSRVIQFNNFIGKPVYLDIINTCYAEGVFLEESTNALMFPGLAIANPADISAGQPTGQSAETSAGAREMIESYSFIEPQYRTQPNGKVVQVLRFELIKAIKNYRNKAPPLNLNEQNPFKVIGDLRYFLTSGYYAVETRTSAIVAFQNPFGMRQQIAFPIILRDWWNALDYAERITENYISYGDNTTEPESCINPQATDFLKYSPAPHNITYKTTENGYLFKKGEIKTIAKPGPSGAQPARVETGCGTVDYISLQIPEQLTYKANNGLVMNIRPDPSDPSHELEITFDPTNWDGTKTSISHKIHAKVTRQQTGKTALVSFDVKFIIAENKEIMEKKKPTTPTTPQQPTQLQACVDETRKEYGKTGKGIYEELGLGKISYEWRENQIKEDTCDASATGSKYCDETQALLSIMKKVEKVKEVMKKIKSNNNNIGECKGWSDCSNGLKSTEIYRYVVPQTEQGYFTNENGSLLEIYEIKEDKDTKEMTEKETKETEKETKDTQHNKQTLDKFNNFIDKAKSKISDLGGAEVIVEIKTNKNNNKDKIKNLFSGSTESGDYVIVKAEEYKVFNQKLIEATSPTININNIELTHDLATHIVQNSTMKIVAKNSDGINEKTKKLILEKATAKINYGITDLNKFYHTNVEPEMLLMEGKYNGELINKFKAKYTKYNNITITDLETKPGVYKATIEVDKDTNIKLEKIREATYNNVLFSIPFNAPIDWGYSVNSDNLALKKNENDNVTPYFVAKKISSSSSTNINVVEKRTFGDVASGKILSISKSQVEMSFSDPVKLEINVNKKQGENAFVLYKLFNPNNKEEQLSLDFYNKNEKMSSSITDAKLCSSTLTGFYQGLSFTESQAFNRTYSALVFSPTRIKDNSSAIEFLQCTNNALTSVITYDLLDEKSGQIATNYQKSLRVAFSSDKMNNYYMDKYNLQKLIDLVENNFVCVNYNNEKIEFYWNKSKFQTKVVGNGS